MSEGPWPPRGSDQPGDDKGVRRRQRDRARITGLLLGALALLIFLITVAKIRAGMA